MKIKSLAIESKRVSLECTLLHCFRPVLGHQVLCPVAFNLPILSLVYENL